MSNMNRNYTYSAHQLLINLQEIFDIFCYVDNKRLVDRKFLESAERLTKRLSVPNLHCSPHEIRHVEQKVQSLKKIINYVLFKYQHV